MVEDEDSLPTPLLPRTRPRSTTDLVVLPERAQGKGRFGQAAVVYLHHDGHRLLHGGEG